MGLDAVQLVMDLEDHFGISIQDAEAERIRTVGDLVSLIKVRIDAGRLAKCPTLSSFLGVRSCAREIKANGQLRIRTETRIVDVLSPSERRQLWNRLEIMLGSHQPSLRRPPFLRKALAAGVLLLVAVAVASAAAIDWAILPLTLTIAGLLTIVMYLSTVRFRVTPPDGMATFGLIAKRISGARVATERLNLRTFDAILEEIRPIVANALGVDGSQVVAESRFVQDLGMG